MRRRNQMVNSTLLVGALVALLATPALVAQKGKKPKDDGDPSKTPAILDFPIFCSEGAPSCAIVGDGIVGDVEDLRMGTGTYIDGEFQGWVNFPGTGNLTFQTDISGKKLAERHYFLNFPPPIEGSVPDPFRDHASEDVLQGGFMSINDAKCEDSTNDGDCNDEEDVFLSHDGALRDMKFLDGDGVDDGVTDRSTANRILARVGQSFSAPEFEGDLRLRCGERFDLDLEGQNLGTDYINVACVKGVVGGQCTKWEIYPKDPTELRCRLYQHIQGGKGSHTILTLADYNMPFEIVVQLK